MDVSEGMDEDLSNSVIICNMNPYCEHNDVAYWLLFHPNSHICLPQGVDDSRVMDEDLSFGEMYQTSMDL